MLARVASNASGDAGGVQVIRRAARILEALKGQPDGLSLSQIASRVKLPRSTVHRLIAALEQEGFVASASPNGRFRVGPTLVSFAMTADRDLAAHLHRFLVELSQEVNETVDLAVLRHDRVLFIDQVESPQRLQAVSAVGVAFPTYCTANGKALLAGLPPEQVERLLPERLHRLTAATIVDRSALLDELEQVRVRGVAYDLEEHTAGICAVGAAVRQGDRLVAAISVPIPMQRFDRDDERLVDALKRTCARAERALAGADASAWDLAAG